MKKKLPHNACHQDKAKGRAIVTGAVSNTKVLENYWVGLRTLAKYYNCPLHVIPIAYKNVSAFAPREAWEPVWDSSLHDNIVTSPIRLGQNIVIRPDIHVEATAAKPLAGKGAINGAKWTVFGSPKTMLECVPSAPGSRPKRMYTTGAVTVSDYSQTDRGAKAHFHHTFNALLIEWDDKADAIWVRHLGANSSGVFNDLDLKINGRRISSASNPLALALGDEHVGAADPYAVEATHGKSGLVQLLKPQHLIRHDVFDGRSVSPHDHKDGFERALKHLQHQYNVRRELDEFVDYINATTVKGVQNVIVQSNHHEWLDRWLDRVNPLLDLSNAKVYHELWWMLWENLEAGRIIKALQAYAEPRLKVPATWLDYAKPFIVGEIDFGSHGHAGANGAKGTLSGHSKYAARTVSGHTHTVGIADGAWSVGGMVKRQRYEKGYSTHDIAHVVLYKDSGKRSVVDICGKRFWLEG